MSSLASEALPVFIKGLEATIFFSFGSVVIGFLMAVALCTMRLSKSVLLSSIAAVYVSFFRGIPLMVQLLISFYCLPVIGINVSPGASALFTMAACTAAYMAEILRGGFLGISYGQIEAAQISGLSRFQILKEIEVPQAVRLTLPSLINEVVNMVKASSLISVVGVLDLTRAAQNVAASTYKPLSVYLTAGILYLIVTSSIGALEAVAQKSLKAERQG